MDGSAWTPGVYVVLLTKQDTFQTYAIFILRNDTRHAEVAVHLATATWHAYNDFGGEKSVRVVTRDARRPCGQGVAGQADHGRIRRRQVFI